MKKTSIFLLLIVCILFGVNFSSTCKKYNEDLMKQENNTYKTDIYVDRLKNMQNEPKSKPSPNLTKALAEKREFSVLNCSIVYNIHQDLDKGTEYRGKITIEFRLTYLEDVFLEYTGRDFNIIELNGQEVPENYKKNRKDGFIYIPKELLRRTFSTNIESLIVATTNFQKIEFESSYDNDGYGLHSFIDTDGLQYLYSHGLIAKMNRIFPCFDQPDLKGKMNLTVSAPNDWNVISNEKSKERKTLSSKFVWSFEETQDLPVYDYVLYAGPYIQVKQSKDLEFQKYGIMAFCRKSLNEHLQKDFNIDYIIDSLEKSIAEYEKFTGIWYPFSRAILIFVPEFPKNSKEHANTITMNEKFLFREKPDLEQLSLRHHNIAYEIAHTWLGNLVSMKWWNDIWLNEAQSDFTATLMTSKIYEKKNLNYTIHDPWVLANSMRNNAYNLDSIETSHPIHWDAPDTDSALNFYDELTYYKASALIKQLYFLIEEKPFSDLLNWYIQHKITENANFDDLNKIQDKYMDEKEFKKQWVLSPGHNEITANWELGSIEVNAKIEQIQKPVFKQHTTLRRHKLKVGFFNKNLELLFEEDYILEPKEVNTFTYDASSGEVAAVIPNIGDWAWCKIGLDKNTFSIVNEKVDLIQDTLTKNLAYRALCDRSIATGNSTLLYENLDQ